MKILRVDMTNLEASFEALPEELLILGGRGLTSKILCDEVDPATDPLGKEAKFVIATGPLAATRAPSCGRLSVGAKSPLTNGIKEANSGGPAAQKLDRLGIRAIIIEGSPAGGELHQLHITKDAVTFKSAAELLGKGNYQVAEELRAEYGDKVSVAMIGVAGERRAKSAAVTFTDTEGRSSRHAARGGVGAVLGAKGVKAIVIDDKGTKPVKIADKEAFKNGIKNWAEFTKSDELLQTRHHYGTPGNVGTLRGIGSMPSKNYGSEQTEGYEQLDGPEIARLNKGRGGKMHGCMPGCLVQCSVIFHGPDKKHLTSSFEYETLGLMGTNLGLSDPDVVATLDRACDEFGIDTIELGAAMGVAASEGKMTMGDAASALALMKQVEEGTEFGKILADGVVATCKALGVTRIPAFKGQAIPAHDPRVTKPTGVTYLTNPMGADHTAGLTYDECFNDEGAVERSLKEQVYSTLCDSFGFCILAGSEHHMSTVGFLRGLVNARFGLEVGDEALVSVGRDTLRRELDFNDKSGFHTVNEPDPAFVRSEPVAPFGAVFDVDPEEVKAIWSGLDTVELKPAKAQKKKKGAGKKTIKEISTICYIGAGTMGCYNSLIATLAGYDAVIYDLSEENLKLVSKKHQEIALLLVGTGYCTSGAITEALKRVTLSSDLAEATANAQLVSESVFERIDVKRQVFEELDRVCPPGTIITTNSSALLGSEIETTVEHGGRFAALHSYLGSMLIDVVGATRTDKRTIDILKRYVVSLGGFPLVLKKEYPGYALNAMLAPILMTANVLLADGVATVEEIDRAWMFNRKAPMGPFGMMDFFGLDVSLDNMGQKHPNPEIEKLKEKFKPIFAGKVEKGELGMKTGRGFYGYPSPAYQKKGFLEGADKLDNLYRDLSLALIQGAVQVAAHEVADFEDVDRAWMVATKQEMGPFGMLDALGLDEFLKTLKTDADIKAVFFNGAGSSEEFLAGHIERGELGLKSGKGFYEYPKPKYEEADFLKVGEPEATAFKRTKPTGHMMPAHFGPVPPNPKASGWYRDVTIMVVPYLTDRELLQQYLPEPYEVGAEPIVTVMYACNKDVDWLAGRGYNLVGVHADAVFKGEEEELTGQYALVMWENLTDPILTGRELQGVPKIYGEIPEHEVGSDRWSTSVSHFDNKILDLSISNLRAPTMQEITDGQREMGEKDNPMGWRFMPGLLGMGRPKIDEATLFPSENVYSEAQVGEGEIKWHELTWEQNPTQYHIVNALAKLPILEYRTAFVAKGKSNLIMPNKLPRVIK